MARLLVLAPIAVASCLQNAGGLLGRVVNRRKEQQLDLALATGNVFQWIQRIRTTAFRRLSLDSKSVPILEAALANPSLLRSELADILEIDESNCGRRLEKIAEWIGTERKIHRGKSHLRIILKPAGLRVLEQVHDQIRSEMLEALAGLDRPTRNKVAKALTVLDVIATGTQTAIPDPATATRALSVQMALPLPEDE